MISQKLIILIVVALLGVGGGFYVVFVERPNPNDPITVSTEQTPVGENPLLTMSEQQSITWLSRGFCLADLYLPPRPDWENPKTERDKGIVNRCVEVIKDSYAEDTGKELTREQILDPRVVDRLEELKRQR